MLTRCSHCAKTLKVDDARAGKVARCPQCAGLIRIPPHLQSPADLAHYELEPDAIPLAHRVEESALNTLPTDQLNTPGFTPAALSAQGRLVEEALQAELASSGAHTVQRAHVPAGHDPDKARREALRRIDGSGMFDVEESLMAQHDLHPDDLKLDLDDDSIKPGSLAAFASMGPAVRGLDPDQVAPHPSGQGQIRVICGSCAANLGIPPDFAGQLRLCPRCKAVIVVPRRDGSLPSPQEAARMTEAHQRLHGAPTPGEHAVVIPRTGAGSSIAPPLATPRPQTPRLATAPFPQPPAGDTTGVKVLAPGNASLGLAARSAAVQAAAQALAQATPEPEPAPARGGVMTLVTVALLCSAVGVGVGVWVASRSSAVAGSVAPEPVISPASTPLPTAAPPPRPTPRPTPTPKAKSTPSPTPVAAATPTPAAPGSTADVSVVVTQVKGGLFAVKGFQPAPMGQRHVFVTAQLLRRGGSALIAPPARGAEPDPATTALLDLGPLGRVATLGQQVPDDQFDPFSLGAFNPAPVRLDAQTPQRTITLAFLAPESATTATLLIPLADPTPVDLSAALPKDDTGGLGLVGVWEKDPQQQQRSLYDDPIIEAFRARLRQRLVVRQTGETLALEAPGAAIFGTAEGLELAPGVAGTFTLRFQLNAAKLEAKARLFNGGKQLLVSFKDEPLHQFTFNRAAP